ncbi:MAG: hypothetical protein JNM63_16785, partial [Spirochaetia bacterium]|nr:hypothetical protein [Spirochaetia bacterium]
AKPVDVEKAAIVIHNWGLRNGAQKTNAGLLEISAAEGQSCFLYFALKETALTKLGLAMKADVGGDVRISWKGVGDTDFKSENAISFAVAPSQSFAELQKDLPLSSRVNMVRIAFSGKMKNVKIKEIDFFEKDKNFLPLRFE